MPGILAEMGDYYEGTGDVYEPDVSSDVYESEEFTAENRDGDAKEEAKSGHHHQKKSHAHSFQHHHGPVTGHHVKVEWKDKHGHHEHDFKAHPHYKFAYGVQDHHTKDFKGQVEHRDGNFPETSVNI